jgi:hypothetical protein
MVELQELNRPLTTPAPVRRPGGSGSPMVYSLMSPTPSSLRSRQAPTPPVLPQSTAMCVTHLTDSSDYRTRTPRRSGRYGTGSVSGSVEYVIVPTRRPWAAGHCGSSTAIQVQVQVRFYIRLRPDNKYRPLECGTKR